MTRGGSDSILGKVVRVLEFEVVLRGAFRFYYAGINCTTRRFGYMLIHTTNNPPTKQSIRMHIKYDRVGCGLDDVLLLLW